eukprot:7481827-Pyramimonas_sp.AAC.1
MALSHVSQAAAFRTAQGSETWGRYQKRLDGIVHNSNGLHPFRLSRGWFANSFLSFMAENYAKHLPRARAINPTAPFLVSHAKLASSLRAD